MDWSIIGGALTQHTLAHHYCTQHLTFALRSLPKAERERWRPIIEHYIFGSEEVVFAHSGQRAEFSSQINKEGCFSSDLSLINYHQGTIHYDY